MDLTGSKIIISGLLLIIALVTGIWLAFTGRPLNTFIFTAHKLSALAALIFGILGIYNLF